MPFSSRFKLSGCHKLHVSAVVDPAAQQAELDDQLRVSVVFIFLDLIFFSHEPTVKRARAHTDAVPSASCVFKLFIFRGIASHRAMQ